MIIRTSKELALAAAKQRKKLGLTQSEVAHRVGLQQKTISAFENNPESIMLETAFLILSSLHLDLELNPKSEDLNKNDKWTQEW